MKTKNKSIPNPDRLKLLVERQSDYLFQLHYLHGKGYYYNFTKEGAVEKLYRDNEKAYKLLDISLGGFGDFIKNGYFGSDSGNRSGNRFGRRRERASLWSWKKQNHKIGDSTYRESTEHKKLKDKLSEEEYASRLDRETWRNASGVNRDNARKNSRKRSWRRGPRKFYKRSAAKRLRQYFRENLYWEQNWDDLIGGQDLRKFPAYDSWIWD